MQKEKKVTYKSIFFSLKKKFYEICSKHKLLIFLNLLVEHLITSSEMEYF